MKTIYPSKHVFAMAGFILSWCCCYSANATPLNLSTTPLVIAGAVDPNAMLLLDTSGSMKNIVPDTPYDPMTPYGTCNGKNKIPDGERIDLILLDNGDAMIYRRDTGTLLSWSDSSSKHCFGATYTYDARLYGDGHYNSKSIGGYYRASNYLSSEYSGNYLNWYFTNSGNNGPANFGAWSRKRPGTYTRMEIAQTAASDLMDNLKNIRVGLAVYYDKDDDDANDYSGATIKEGLDDIASNRTAMKNAINSLSPGGLTPLGHALEQLGRYYVQGKDQELTIHPDSSADKVDAYDFLHLPPRYDDSNDIPTSLNPAIQYSCQKSFIVTMTDGRPQGDRDYSSDSDVYDTSLKPGDSGYGWYDFDSMSDYLEDYDGDCDSASPACLDYDMKNVSPYNYESRGSDYFDDVAMALFDVDLRPDFADYKNNVRTYVIGFADKQVINDKLVDDAAKAGQGGQGEFLKPANSGELEVAFARVANELAAAGAAVSSVSFNSSQLYDTGSLVFQATFQSATWTGDLGAIELNADGSLPTTMSGGEEVFVTDWNASDELDNMSWSNRNILTYSDASGSWDGVEFTWSNLTSAQKDDFYKGVDGLDVDSDGTITDFSGGVKDVDDAQSLLDYIKGDSSNEVSFFRQRTHLLGDIVDSSPVYVGKPQLNWPDFSVNSLFGGAGKDYSDYKNNTTRTPVVYVGANDGMLHGFEANLSSASSSAGDELIAYIPSTVYSSNGNKGLHYLSNPYYNHEFYVNQTPTVSDVYIKRDTVGTRDWRTVLVGGMNSGGRGLYALDVSDPSEFANPGTNAANVVLWEFTNADDGDLGFTYGQPSIVMLPNGKWAAIVSNGYNSDNERAALFILFLEGGLDGSWTLGTDYIKIYAEKNGSTANGGLSTPRVVDMDGDKVADRVYAGDLNGNMWAFDLSDSNPSNWGVAYSSGSDKVPLFTAQVGGVPQPITSIPIVAKNGNVVTISDDPSTPTVEGNEPNTLVLFGTGKFLEPSDVNSNTDQMSYYAIWDANSGNVSRSDLAVRTITNTTITNVGTGGTDTVRTISGSAIDWSTQKGWYMDFLATGERVVAPSLLRREILFFNTIIPSSVACSFGGSGWLMSVDYDTGLPATFAVFDANNDGVIDSNDFGFVGQNVIDGLPSGSGVLGNTQYTTTTDSGVAAREVEVGAGALEGRLNWSEVFRN